MARRSYELPLRNDSSVRFLPGIVALMVYLASLSLAGMLAVHGMVERWDRGLTGTLTVELPPAPEDGSDDGAVALALQILTATPGVLSAQAIGAPRMAALLAPWIGDGIDPNTLPLPRLIDLRVDPKANLDIAALDQRIAAAVPGAHLDDHRRWLDRVIRAAYAIEAVAAGVVILVGIAAMLAVIFATRTGLAVHHSVVEVLHLIGARDLYIARQFESHALRLALKGGIIGLFFAGLTLALLALASQRAGSVSDEIRLLPDLSVPALRLTLLLALPPLAGLIAMVTARLTVLRALARMR